MSETEDEWLARMQKMIPGWSGKYWDYHVNLRAQQEALAAIPPHDSKYAKIALQFGSKIGKRVGGSNKAKHMWALASHLEENDNGKHEQHLIMLASKWVKSLPMAEQKE